LVRSKAIASASQTSVATSPYFSVAASLPEARGLFMSTGDLLRLRDGPQRVFLVVRRPRGQNVVAALPAARVPEI